MFKRVLFDFDLRDQRSTVICPEILQQANDKREIRLDDIIDKAAATITPLNAK